MRSLLRGSLVLVAGSVVLSGCSSAGSDAPSPPIHRSREALLTQAQSCEQLESLLKGDQIAKLEAQIESMRRWAAYYDEYYGSVSAAGDGAVSSSATGSSGTGGGSGGPDQGGGAAGNDHSETNTQVAGVDEADIVKTDGEHIYVLHGQELAIVNAYPAADLSLARKVAIEG